MADVQVRGCCCGIPFGCGTLMFLAPLGILASALVPNAPNIALTSALLLFGKLAAIFGVL